jgi:hypothetical protein
MPLVRLGALFRSENFEGVLNLLIKIIKWAATAVQGKIGEIHPGARTIDNLFLEDKT